MRKQLGIDSRMLLQRIKAVTHDELAEAAKEYFSRGKYATAIVNVKKD